MAARLGTLAALLATTAVALAGCGGDQESTTVTLTNTETQTRTETVEAEPVLTVKTSDVALKGPTFQMPSKNIGCAMSDDKDLGRYVRCDIQEHSWPMPPRPDTRAVSIRQRRCAIWGD